MINKLPVVGKRYSWKHNPERFSLVLGFLRDKIIVLSDRDIDEPEDEILEFAEIMTPEVFNCLTGHDEQDTKKETYRCAHDYVLKNQGYNNSDMLIKDYECSICGESKMTIRK